MASECWDVWYVDIFVNYGFYEHKAGAGDRVMAWLMISRVDNARWRSLSNRESGCMKKIVEKGGREMDIKRARKQIECVKENAELLILHTILLCCFWWSSALLIHIFSHLTLFNWSSCSGFFSVVFEELYYAALRNFSLRVFYFISHLKKCLYI